MRSSSNAQLQTPLSPFAESAADAFPHDPRWALARTVAVGPHFARSPLLSKFLLYVVSETLSGRQATISEHRIGVTVFGRPPSYRTDEDNIVRNYARQLRKRLADHFTGVGSNEFMRIEMPVGGYVPAFQPMEKHTLRDNHTPLERLHVTGNHLQSSEPSRPGAWVRKRGAFAALVFLVSVLASTFAVWLSSHWPPARFFASDTSRTLWHAFLPAKGTVYVVPSDAGFNLLEDMSHHRIPLADYLKGSFSDASAPPLNSHSLQDLYSQRYTDLVSMQIIALLARQPEYDPERVLVRFPRDLRIDDLKAANALIVGSANSNPWASLGDATTNFRVVPRDDMEGAAIINSQPLAGEQPSYQSHWNEPSHDTYALILFVPNLSGTGHLLVVEGLDVAGTEAAAELLFHPESIAPVIGRAKRPDGSMRSFEILLRANSIQSNAEGTQVIASRIR